VVGDVFVAEVDPDRPTRLKHPHPLAGAIDQVGDVLGRGRLVADLAGVVLAAVAVGTWRVIRRRGDDQVNGFVGERQLSRVGAQDRHAHAATTHASSSSGSRSAIGSPRGPSMKCTMSFCCGLKLSGITFGMHLSQKYAPSNDCELCAAKKPLQPAQIRRYEVVMSRM